MIIVSQNKEHILNFENITEIRIAYAMSIRVNLFRDCELILGFYQTEERAKEVLQEIIEIHRVSIPTAVYEMPEE